MNNDGFDLGCHRGNGITRRQELGAGVGFVGIGSTHHGVRGDAEDAEAPPVTTIYQVAAAGKLVALTFDVELDRGYAPAILDTLANAGVKASWGLTGKWADANGDLVARIVSDGHQLINHTYSHRSLTGAHVGSSSLTREERLEELARTEAVLIEHGGKGAMPWFRPPFGEFDGGVLRDIAEAGFRWNVM